MDGRTQLGVGVIVSVVVLAIAGVLIFQWPFLWVPAVLGLIVAAMVLTIYLIDRRTRNVALLPPMSDAARETVVRRADWRIGVATTVTLVVGLAAIAFVLATLFFGWRIAGFGMLFVLAWMALLGWPVWVATIEEEVESEHEHLTGESRAIH
jgi:hypothetical protein